jgi:DNA (cytosine-5)-methyltransferase 1
MLRVIREVKPTWVVGENVRGIVSWNGGMVFNEVQADLEAIGYETIPFILPACGVNAPHKRDRVWFVAYRKNMGCKRTKPEHWEGNEDCKRSMCEREKGRNDIWPITVGHGQQRTTPNSQSEQSKRLRPEQRETCNEEQEQFGGNGSAMGNGTFTDTNSGRQPGKEYGQEESGRVTKKGVPGDWQNFPTQPPVCGRNDEFSGRLDGITFPKWRNESIKAYGNAVVPALVFQIFKSIQQYNDLPPIP